MAFFGGENSMFFRHRKTSTRKLCFDAPEQVTEESETEEESATNETESAVEMGSPTNETESADEMGSPTNETESADELGSLTDISEITWETSIHSVEQSSIQDGFANSVLYDCMKEDKALKHLSKSVMFERVMNRIVQNIALILFLQDSVQLLSEYQQIFDDLYFIYFDFEKINAYSNKRFFLDIMQQTVLRKNLDIFKYKEEYETVDPTLDNIRYIMEKLQVPTKEKDDRAHVMTPIFLVKQMMQNVPTAFWKNTTKRVLDPCCGYGVFTLFSFMKFNEFLSKKLPNHEKRVKWIIEKCLFFSDLVRYNVKITELLLQFFCNQIAGKDVTGLRFNSFVGNVLTIQYPHSFDLIATNPPFHRKQNNCGKKGGGDALWDKIVVHCTEKLLRQKGLLVVVHPAGWRKPKSKHSKFTDALYNLYTKKYQLLFLSIHDTKEGHKAFHCGTRFDIVCLEKRQPYQKTVIVDEEGVRSEINCKKWPWLPNSHLHQTKLLIAKKNESKCHVLYNRTSYGSDKKYVVSRKTSTHPFPLIHSTPKRGVRKMYSDRNDLGHFGVSKVIFGETGIHHAIIDMKGKYGMTQQAMGITVSNKKEAEDVKKALESPVFKVLLQSCSWSNFRIDWRMFESFKKDWYKNFV